MTQVAKAKLVSAAFLASLGAAGWVLGAKGTIDAVYDLGYSLGSMARVS